MTHEALAVCIEDLHDRAVTHGITCKEDAGVVAEAARVLRFARSDARAKVAEAECEKLRCAAREVLSEFEEVAANPWRTAALSKLRAALLPPPPTVEGDRP